MWFALGLILCDTHVPCLPIRSFEQHIIVVERHKTKLESIFVLVLYQTICDYNHPIHIYQSIREYWVYN